MGKPAGSWWLCTRTVRVVQTVFGLRRLLELSEQLASNCNLKFKRIYAIVYYQRTTEMCTLVHLHKNATKVYERKSHVNTSNTHNSNQSHKTSRWCSLTLERHRRRPVFPDRRCSWPPPCLRVDTPECTDHQWIWGCSLRRPGLTWHLATKQHHRVWVPRDSRPALLWCRYYSRPALLCCHRRHTLALRCHQYWEQACSPKQ